VVEIITSNTAQPTKDWLNFCTTTRALGRIRNFLRSEQREKSINLGRELLENELRAAGMSYSKFTKNDAEVRRLVAHFKANNLDDLLLSVGYGKSSADDVSRALKSREGPTVDAPPPELREGKLQQLARRLTGRDQSGIRVSGEDDVLVRFAKCCNPLPGDPIVGFITRGRGVTVHRRQCVKTFDMDPERRIDVTWDTKAKINRPVQLRVTTTGSPSLLAVISQVFSAQKLSINEANCRAGEDGRACNTFTFNVSDLNQLKAAMREISKISGVVEVERA
jgi:GTP pyrophosphokinase